MAKHGVVDAYIFDNHIKGQTDDKGPFVYLFWLFSDYTGISISLRPGDNIGGSILFLTEITANKLLTQ